MCRAVGVWVSEKELGLPEIGGAEGQGAQDEQELDRVNGWETQDWLLLLVIAAGAALSVAGSAALLVAGGLVALIGAAFFSQRRLRRLLEDD